MASPARYDIEALLNKGVQPLDDLDPDALKELGKGIGKGPLAIPVSVTEDGTLIDGHQRLKAMLGNGRKFIDANDVRVIPGATDANALEWAVRLNVQRRHLTVDQKADLARKLQATRGWSQGRIAKAFGVSRPAVSQWLAKAAPDDDVDTPTFVTGLDGRAYVKDRTPPKPPVEKKPTSPWRPDGYAFQALAKARKQLGHDRPVAGINVLHEAKLRALAEDLINELEELLAELSEDAGGEEKELS